jgi:hypothetical protein
MLGGKEMVWLCFTGQHKVQIVIFTVKMNSAHKTTTQLVISLFNTTAAPAVQVFIFPKKQCTVVELRTGSIGSR